MIYPYNEFKKFFISVTSINQADILVIIIPYNEFSKLSPCITSINQVDIFVTIYLYNDFTNISFLLLPSIKLIYLLL